MEIMVVLICRAGHYFLYFVNDFDSSCGLQSTGENIPTITAYYLIIICYLISTVFCNSAILNIFIYPFIFLRHTQI